MKNRIRQKANRKLKAKEQALERYNGFGVKDLTAYNAVQQIRSNGKAPIALK